MTYIYACLFVDKYIELYKDEYNLFKKRIDHILTYNEYDSCSIRIYYLKLNIKIKPKDLKRVLNIFRQKEFNYSKYSKTKLKNIFNTAKLLKFTLDEFPYDTLQYYIDNV